MSVNGVTGVGSTDAYTAPTTRKTTDKTKDTTTAASTAKDNGVVYEKSTASAKSYKPNAELISKMKADADAQTANLQRIVQEMITKQGSSYGQTNDMWKILSGGNFTVDAATKKQAQADIAEDGYWGVNKTSDRIIDFAKALTGGDPSKIEEMRSAFEKGFRQATGAWGKDLPGISQDTYSATMDKFDQWAEEAKNTSSSSI